MAKLVSPSEMEALLEIGRAVDGYAEGDEKALEALPDEQAKPIWAYNFRQPRLLGPDQLRAFNQVHESFARKLAVQFSALLRTIVDVSLYSSDQFLYSQYVSATEAPSALYVMEVMDGQHRAILEIDPRLGIFVVERLFGGPGTLMVTPREVSRIEQRILAKVMDRAMDALSNAWEEVHPFELVGARFRSEISSVQIVPGIESVMVATFEVTIAERTTLLNLCYPGALIEALLDRPMLQRRQASPASQPAPGARPAFERAVGAIEVDVRAELGRTQVSMRDVLELAAGDILLLNKSRGEVVEVFVDDRLKFRASPGQIGKKRALKITEILSPRGSDETAP